MLPAHHHLFRPSWILPAMNTFSGNSDCLGYPHDASLPDDLFSDQEQFVESLIGTHDKRLHQCEVSLPDDLFSDHEQFLESLIGTHDKRLFQDGPSLPEDLYPNDSQEQFLSTLNGTHGASLPDDLYPDYSHEQLLSFPIADPNEGNNYEDRNSEINSFYLEPSNAKSPLTSNMSAKLDGSVQELHQPYGKTEFKFYFEDISPNPLSPTTKLNKAPNDFDKDFAQCFSRTAKQNQPLENVLITAERERDCKHKSCSCNGKQFNAELEQVNSSLSAEISHLKVLVDKLTHQIQDLSDKLSCQKNLSAPYVDESVAQDALFCKAEDKRQKIYETFASISNWGASIVDQSVMIAIATDYFPSRNIPTSPAYELNQPTSGQQSVFSSAVNGMVKEVDQQLQLSGKSKSAISAAGKKKNSVGSAIPKNKHIFPGVSFLSGSFNKVHRAATNVVSKMKRK